MNPAALAVGDRAMSTFGGHAGVVVQVVKSGQGWVYLVRRDSDGFEYSGAEGCAVVAEAP